MKIIPWIIGISVVLVIIPASILFSNLVFRSQITQMKVNFSPEYIPLIDSVAITEIKSDAKASLRELIRKPIGMLLYEDGSIKEGDRVFDGDPGKEVIVSFNGARKESLVFKNNNVFKYSDNSLGDEYGVFPEPEFKYIDLVLPINNKYLLINAAMKDSPYPSERELWQAEYDGLNKLKLTTEPYYTDDRPPEIFSFDNNEQVVVYYVGSYDFAYGGDSSRPMFSVLRVFNSQYPEGRDIIKFGFKAGVVLSVIKEDDNYFVVTDPSLPAMAEKTTALLRKWKIDIE